MVPPKSHPRYRQLVTGEYSHSFKSVSTSMLVSLHIRRVQASQKNPEAIAAGVEAISVFFSKYEDLLTDDLNAIFGIE
jgi:hypothetical protein